MFTGALHKKPCTEAPSVGLIFIHSASVAQARSRGGRRCAEEKNPCLPDDAVVVLACLFDKLINVLRPPLNAKLIRLKHETTLYAEASG